MKTNIMKSFAVVLLLGVSVVVLQRTEFRSTLHDILGIGVSNAAQDAGPQTTEAAPPRVEVAEVVAKQITPYSEFTGFLEASKSVYLRPRVSGLIKAVTVPEGENVEAGQALFQIDPRPFNVALAAARADLQQAVVLMENAQDERKRAEVLARKGSVPDKVLDDAAALERQRATQVDRAKAAVAAAELDLSFASVEAPITGRVDRVLVDEGNLVSGGDAGSATLLTTIVATDVLHVYFDIDEATYLNLANWTGAKDSFKGLGLAVQIGLADDDGFPHSGVLEFLSNRVDQETGTIRARASVSNREGRLTPGLYARVKMATGLPTPSILIAESAVGVEQGRRYVLALTEANEVEYRSVELGQKQGGLRVISSGLKHGDRIVLKGLVGPGAKVTPNLVDMPVDGTNRELPVAAAQQEARL
jgi:gold/copper resistance efflux system membrane fusion protein